MAEDSQTLAVLHDRVRGGDTDALADFFAHQRQRLWRMVHFRLDRKLAGRVDCDDILQESYLAATTRIAHYQGDGPESLFVWMRLIVRQTMIDVHRRHLGAAMRDAQREVSLGRGSWSQSTAATMSAVLVGRLTSPSQAAMRAEMTQRVAAALEQMDEIDSEVLALRHFEELTNAEVARELSIEPKAASIRYVRAVKRLREVLADVPGLASEDLHA